MSFWAELKRRNVFRVAAAYLVASWLIVQVIGQLIEPLSLPDSFDTIVVVLLGVGFPIALVIAWIYEVTPAGVRVTSEVATSPSGGQSGHRLNYVIVALLIAAVGLLAFDSFVTNDQTIPRDEIAAGGVNPADTDAAEKIRLAVFPFDDLSQAGDQAYLANGISGEIRSRLSLVDGLDVIRSASSPVLKEQYSDFRALREDWNVGYVLTGEVLDADDQLRVRIDLTDTATDAITYTSPYESTRDDTLALIDEIAEAVAQALQVTLGVGEVGGRLGMTRNVNAFEEFLRGSEIQGLTPAGLREAIAHFERAVDLDDTFSLAWYSIYFSSVVLDSLLQAEGGDPSARNRADEALGRIQALTPGLPELVFADILFNRELDFFELRERFDDLTRSASENNYPDSAIAFAQGTYLFITGRIAEAVGLLERAYALDPLNNLVVQVLTEIYAAQGRPEDSRELALAYGEQVGGFFQATVIYTRAAQTALEMNDKSVLDEVLTRWRPLANTGAYSALFSRMGELIDEPERAIEELDAFFRSGEYAFWGTHAIPWAAYFGDEELVLEMLAEADLFTRATHLWRPLLADTRKTDGFKQLMRTIGLEPFWRETGNWPDYCEPVGLNDFECY